MPRLFVCWAVVPHPTQLCNLINKEGGKVSSSKEEIITSSCMIISFICIFYWLNSRRVIIYPVLKDLSVA